MFTEHATNLDISIVTYNSTRWLKSFFESILVQDFPSKNINLFIRDNGSTDDTVSQLSEFIHAHQQKFSKIELAVGANIGFGSGHNDNLKKSTSPFFLVTNVDLTFDINSLQKIMTIAIKDNENVASWEFRQKPYEHPKWYDPITLETAWSSSACILFRRTALEKINGYDEKLFLYGEDVDISYRLRDAGFILKYCPSVVCWHYSYEYANEIKPAQYFGSIFSNLFIRIRFGSFFEILKGFLFYLYLLIRGPKIKNRRKILFQNLIKILKLLPYLIKTRKKSKLYFPFNRMDYEKTRMGAFYVNKALPDNLPLVTIITRTYQDRLEWLKEAAASLINQTYPHIEWVVIEDGSETAREYLKTIETKFSRVRYQSIPKAGRCVAGNVGLDLAQGEYIGFLDDDDLLFADHIEVLINELLENKNYHASCAISITAFTKIQSLNPLKYLVNAYKHQLTKPFSRISMSYTNQVSIQSVLFKKSLYTTLGGFDIELDALEDWDLWVRYATKKTFYFIQKTTSLFRVPASVKERINRMETFSNFYPLAREKQKGYFIEDLSFFELSTYALSKRLTGKKALKYILLRIKKLAQRFC